MAHVGHAVQGGPGGGGQAMAYHSGGRGGGGDSSLGTRCVYMLRDRWALRGLVVDATCLRLRQNDHVAQASAPQRRSRVMGF